MSENLREALEKAVEENTTPEISSMVPPPEPPGEGSKPDGTAAPETPAVPDGGTAQPEAKPEAKPEETKPETEGKEDAQPVTPESVRSRVDRPPQSWRGDAKKSWGELPLAVRQEVYKRESEVQTVLREGATIKTAMEQLDSVMAPHYGWIQTTQLTPIDVVNNLLNMELTARSGTPQQKVELAAQYLIDYGIDLAALDKTLAARLNGQQPARPQQNSADLAQLVRQAVAESLSPIYAEREQETNERVQTTLAAFAESHLYYEDLRSEMADIMEFQVAKGRPISLDQAYKQALSFHPELQQNAQLQEKQQQSAQLRNAAVSISGGPRNPGPKETKPDPTNLRGVLEAQFSEPGGRI